MQRDAGIRQLRRRRADLMLLIIIIRARNSSAVALCLCAAVRCSVAQGVTAAHGRRLLLARLLLGCQRLLYLRLRCLLVPRYLVQQVQLEEADSVWYMSAGAG